MNLTGAIVQLRLAMDGHVADIVAVGEAVPAPALRISERFDALFALTPLLNATEHKLLFVVAWRDGDGRGFYGNGATYAALVRRTGCSRRALQMAAKALKERGLLAVRERVGHRHTWCLSTTFASASAQYAERTGKSVDKSGGGAMVAPLGGAMVAPPLNLKGDNIKNQPPKAASSAAGATRAMRRRSGGLEDDNWHRTIFEFHRSHEGSREFCKWARDNLERRSWNTLLAAWKTWQRNHAA